MQALPVLLGVAILAVAYVAVPALLIRYFDERKPKELRCPDGGEHATVMAAPWRVAGQELGIVLANPVANCSLWSNRARCDGRCLRPTP